MLRAGWSDWVIGLLAGHFSRRLRFNRGTSLSLLHILLLKLRGFVIFLPEELHLANRLFVTTLMLRSHCFQFVIVALQNFITLLKYCDESFVVCD